MVPNWNLGGCSLWIKWALKEFNTALLLPFFFFSLHRRQIYSIWDTEGRAWQKTSCNIRRVDKNAFGLAFLWFNQQGSKGWNTKTAPLLLAKEIEAKAISQSRTGKKLRAVLFQQARIFLLLQIPLLSSGFLFPLREHSLSVLSHLHFHLLNNLEISYYFCNFQTVLSGTVCHLRDKFGR